MYLVRKYKEYQHKKHIKSISPYVNLSKDSIYEPSFYVELRNPKKNRNYLSIGSECVIGGKFVFETEQGEIRVGNRVYIGGATDLISAKGIVIEDDVIISWGCTIYDHNSHSIYWEERASDIKKWYNDCITGNSPIHSKDWSNVVSKEIRICKRAWIGFGVTILKGVTIGEGAVVGAKSVVTKDVPPYTVVAGNPAKVVKIIN